MNLFGYVRSNPINKADPLGLYDAGDAETARQAAELAAKLAGGAGAGGLVAGGLTYGGVAVAGFGAGYAIGYYPGQWTANSPYNPFVYGPLNPFGTPYNPYAAPQPATQGPKQQPTCQPLQPPKPFYWTPPLQFPFSTPTPSGPSGPPKDRDKRERCLDQCLHLLPSPSGDLQSSEFRKCYRQCMGTL